MGVIVGAGLSNDLDPLAGGVDAGRQAAAALGEAEPDLAVVFASGAHLTAPEATLEAIRSVLPAATLIGCGAGGVLGDRRELESGTAVSVWTACLGGGRASAFHTRLAGDEEAPVIEGMPELRCDVALIMLSDPYSFPTDAVLGGLAVDAPGVPVLGGLASARTRDGEAALFLDDQVLSDGAVGVALEDVEMLPCVSQGAAPLGREVTITAAEGNVIHELAGRPAIETIESIVSELDLHQRGADRRWAAAGHRDRRRQAGVPTG